MIETRLFQVRDSGTHIPVMANRMVVSRDVEHQPLRRAGFRVGDYVVFLTKLNTLETQYDKFNWTGGRTMQMAHEYIENRWAETSAGQVIDVAFILGFTASPVERED